MKHKWFSLIIVLAVAVALTACSKKVAKVSPPPPPPPAPAPTATLAASPNVIEQGQSTELTWQTQNADTVTIAGLGTVGASGSRTVTPNDSITYTLTAKGPGGSGEATARVTVNAKPRVVSMAGPSEEELFRQNVKDVFFDFDRYDLRTGDTPTANQDAEFLRQHPNIKIVVEGHCDDRGSDEYNLALGANRANSMKQALVHQGVNADRIQTVSYGKEKPFCSADDEQCWQENRRDHFAFGR
ncbi:MAG TPA: peptidoglycan-associated lipoprotein Pal [Terriglobales bacterium]|nr:peptidoglycan-associated lipoprotein Pal [Terriglobales bacterium]